MVARPDSTDYAEYRARQNEVGDVLEDVVYRTFEAHGYDLGPHKTKKEQIEIGENRAGVEIKHDTIAAGTKRYYIEIAESAKNDKNNMVPSGIYAKDNRILLAIGSPQLIHVFIVKVLQRLEQSGLFEYFTKEDNPNDPFGRRGTSRGFYLPFSDANQFCLVKLTPEQADLWQEADKIQKVVDFLRNQGRIPWS
jgi:hypothetical protein